MGKTCTRTCQRRVHLRRRAKTGCQISVFLQHPRSPHRRVQFRQDEPASFVFDSTHPRAPLDIDGLGDVSSTDVLLALQDHQARRESPATDVLHCCTQAEFSEILEFIVPRGSHGTRRFGVCTSSFTHWVPEFGRGANFKEVETALTSSTVWRLQCRTRGPCPGGREMLPFR